MLAILWALPLLMQGLANLAGVMAPWVASAAGFSNSPWLLSKTVTLRSPIGRATSALWLLSTGLLIGAGLGVLSQQAWWRPMAIGGAVVSLLAIGLWWKADPPGAKFGAVFNVAEIAALLSPLGSQLVF